MAEGAIYDASGKGDQRDFGKAAAIGGRSEVPGLTCGNPAARLGADVAEMRLKSKGFIGG
ncbi:hypothetical protein [Actinomadura formosensis]|uniref:hypothetical protein n=1 Tax=Actinomadura formosensis TaxID=60706 RepID=UPI003D8BBD21